MARIVVSKHYEAPLSRVFEVFSDIENCADRIPGILKIEKLSDGPMGVGFKWRETRIMFKKEATEEMEITIFEPERRYVSIAHNCGCLYESEYRFEESDRGTMVERSFSATPLTFMAKLFSPLGYLFNGMMRKCLEKDMEALRQVIDGDVNAEPAPAG
ncbi:MAG: SRPBCC family protein [Planctomycetota bacterium]|nr:SRPBCC family protein [Planctomycetota bacterium]